uniref:hypothetical protein n=1 Tax=Acetomicrobium sp. S15 = DSM 107314 TaxID=2529858 RepID=UPI001E5BAF82
NSALEKFLNLPREWANKPITGLLNRSELLELADVVHSGTGRWGENNFRRRKATEKGQVVLLRGRGRFVSLYCILKNS